MPMPPPPPPIQASAFYVAFCVFKDAYMRSSRETWDGRILDALRKCAPFMPEDEERK